MDEEAVQGKQGDRPSAAAWVRRARPTLKEIADMLEPSAHPHDAASPTRPPLRIGWKEHLEFTEWDLRRIRVKIDTGARTSALDVVRYELLETAGGGLMATLFLALDHRHPGRFTRIHTPVLRTVIVRNTAGHARGTAARRDGGAHWAGPQAHPHYHHQSFVHALSHDPRPRSAGERFYRRCQPQVFVEETGRPESERVLAMRLVILSRREELYSTRALVEAANKRGHDVRVLDTLQFDIRVSRRNPELLYQGEPVGPVDAVIPRIGASITYFGLGRRPPVRDDGRVLPQRIAGHRPLARQAALLAVVEPARHRFAADGVHAPGRARARLHRAGGGAAGGGQAAARHAGHRRGAGRDGDGGPFGHRGVPRAGAEHPDSEIHQGGQAAPTSAPWWWAARWWRRCGGRRWPASFAPTSTAAARRKKSVCPPSIAAPPWPRRACWA